MILFAASILDSGYCHVPTNFNLVKGKQGEKKSPFIYLVGPKGDKGGLVGFRIFHSGPRFVFLTKPILLIPAFRYGFIAYIYKLGFNTIHGEFWRYIKNCLESVQDLGYKHTI